MRIILARFKVSENQKLKFFYVDINVINSKIKKHLITLNSFNPNMHRET